MENIGVIGSGAWGTVIASLLADNGHNVCIYGIDKNEIADLKNNHKNTKYFGSEYSVNKTVSVTENFNGIKNYNDVIVLAIPSFAMSETITKIKPILKENTIIINLSKGFDKQTEYTVGEYVRKLLPENFKNNVVSLLGPTYAVEVAEKQFTSITASSNSLKLARKVQQICQNDYFKVFPNDDTIGSEYCASLKNIIALACGMFDGLGYKVNTRATIITEGLKEICTFVKVLGGDINTCYGLAGVGDLVLTCSSSTSRNYTAGYEIGEKSIETFLQTNQKTVEGIFACEIAYKISKEHNLKVPLIDFVYNIVILKNDVLNEINTLKEEIVNQ